MFMNAYIERFLSLFSSFSFNDFFDISIVSYIFYRLIKMFRDSRAAQLLKGLIFVLLLYGFSLIVRLETLTFIIRNLIQYGAFAVIVILMPEIRSGLESIGKSSIFDIQDLFSSDDEEDIEQLTLSSTISIICDACQELSLSKTGALIAFERKSNLGDIIRTGTLLDAEPSVELIGNLFFVNSPLHDGAVIVRDKKIYAAGCYLPLSDSKDISKKYGTRHRAGLGLSETCDAICVMVSEERGTISIADNGNLVDKLSRDDLQKNLEKYLLKKKKK